MKQIRCLHCLHITELDSEEKTLLDEFAMTALTGLMANEKYQDDVFVDGAATDAYLYAKAMMEERKKYDVT